MSGTHKYPKILIVTEEPLRNNSFGFGRTISNIFNKYPIDSLLFYIHEGSFSHKDYFTKFQVITNGLYKFHCAHLRWYAPILNSFFNFINYSIQYFRSNNENINKISTYKPEIVITVPMNYSTLLEGYLISQKMNLPNFVYFMDDTFRYKYWHFGSFTKNLLKKSLIKSAGWIMISKPLANTLSSRYDIPNKPLFILHNPIDLNQSITNYTSPLTDIFSIAYAGSVHNFHSDALINVAEAVFKLRRKGYNIELVIYTNEFSWGTYSKIFERFGVKNGGVVLYEDLFSTLNKSNLLLCTTSFETKFTNLVSTSVFTKITDYLASARSIWCYGPEYSANNKFLLEKGIGYVNSFHLIGELEEFLIFRMNNQMNEQENVEKQLNILNSEYDENILKKNLISYLHYNTKI